MFLIYPRGRFAVAIFLVAAEVLFLCCAFGVKEALQIFGVQIIFGFCMVIVPFLRSALSRFLEE